MSHYRPTRWSPTPLVAMSIGLHAGCIALAPAAPHLLPWIAGALLGNRAILAAVGLMPQSRWLGDNLSRLPRSGSVQRRVALTFDDGPDPIGTPAVLDLLDVYEMRATFFCVGERAASYPSLVRQIIDRGHAVENHSHRHSNLFACYGFRALRRDIATAQAILTELTGRPPRYFRAPMGIRNPFLDPVLKSLGLRLVSWSRRGYDSVSSDPESVLRRFIDRLRPGDILLLHDRAASASLRARPPVLAVLPRLLDHLVVEGFQTGLLPGHPTT